MRKPLNNKTLENLVAVYMDARFKKDFHLVPEDIIAKLGCSKEEARNYRDAVSAIWDLEHKFSRYLQDVRMKQELGMEAYRDFFQGLKERMSAPEPEYAFAATELPQNLDTPAYSRRELH
ncbi:MAG: hypothetical protein V3T58_04645 [Candidatus Hydrothermarchaeales archaeon]